MESREGRHLYIQLDQHERPVHAGMSSGARTGMSEPSPKGDLRGHISGAIGLRSVGFYVRVSTERQAKVKEGSLKNQEQMLRAELGRRNDREKDWGSFVATYVDEGLSGKDTNRPAFQRLMRDIELGRINTVMFTELSRLSRSLKDFLSIFEFAQSHGCRFHLPEDRYRHDLSLPRACDEDSHGVCRVRAGDDFAANQPECLRARETRAGQRRAGTPRLSSRSEAQGPSAGGQNRKRRGAVDFRDL